MVPLLLCGLALDARKDWDWVKKIDDATSEATLALFGSERQVTGETTPLLASDNQGAWIEALWGQVVHRPLRLRQSS